MIALISRRVAIACGMIAIAAIVTTLSVAQVRDKRPPPRNELQLSPMTEKMKTVCVGRFLIDMPEQAQVELARVRVDGFNIVVFDETPEEFRRRVDDREAQIRAKPDRLGGTKNLESVSEVKTMNGMAGKMFVHSRTVTEGTAANGLELERYRYEGIAVEALVHASGISIDLAAEDYFPDQINNVSKLVEKLVPNPRNEKITESGFCIDRAYLRDPLTADQGEEIMMFARLPKHPDIQFMLILSAGGKPAEDGLLKRSAAAQARLSLADRMRTSTLRAAPRAIGGISGEEVVKGAVEENDAHVYSFSWEVNGTADKVFSPRVVFKMNTGMGERGPVMTSMSEGTAIGLWDKISSSIRLRRAELQWTGK